MKPRALALGLVFGLVCVAACAAPPVPARRAESDTYCPTLPEETRGAFIVHGARIFDGERVLDPADVLVANGEVVAVGASLCFRAKVGSVSMVDGTGCTLRPAKPGGRIAAGSPAVLVLVTPSGEIVRRCGP